MASFAVNPGFNSDMTAFDFHDFASLSVIRATKKLLLLGVDDEAVFSIKGSALEYGKKWPVDGTMTAFTLLVEGEAAYTLKGLKLPIETLIDVMRSKPDTDDMKLIQKMLAKADIIQGAEGDDTLAGYGGNDKIDGLDGDDKILGGKGSDVLAGGLGVDMLTGGPGADRFLFSAVGDSTVGTPDTITDFSQAQGDLIDISNLASEKFSFLGENGVMTGLGPEVAFVRPGDGFTYVYVSTTGDGTPEMEIALTGDIDLKEQDFVL